MKTLFEANGPTHLTLMYARMRRTKPFTSEDVLSCFHNKFKQSYMVTRSLKRLESHGLVVQIPQGWSITEAGTQYLFMTAGKAQK